MFYICTLFNESKVLAIRNNSVFQHSRDFLRIRRKKYFDRNLRKSYECKKKAITFAAALKIRGEGKEELKAVNRLR